MSAEWLGVLFAGLLAAGTAGNPERADVELLEFLGSFETADARWLDPLSLGEPAPENPAPPRPDALRPEPPGMENKHAN